MDWLPGGAVGYIAGLSVEWKDESKFTFLWNGQLILVHLDRGRYTILTDLDSETKTLVFKWLNNGNIQSPEEPFEKSEAEEEDDDQTSGN